MLHYNTDVHTFLSFDSLSGTIGDMDDVPMDYDSPWKVIIERYFPEFMAFFFPRAYTAIDWTKGYTFLDKELQQIVRDAESGTRYVDKLVSVTRKETAETDWVLIHIEVQAQRDNDFARRMFVYHYRLYDRYERLVASMAVLSDANQGWRPQQFSHELFDCRVSLDFPVVKLLDYEQDWAALEADPSPFALVVMAQLQSIRTRRNPEERYAAKGQLTRLLYQKGYKRQDILELYRFLDWLMTLPVELEQRFRLDLEQIETEVKMRYVTSIERLAMQEGREEGREEGLEEGRQAGMREMVAETLRTRFGEVPEEVIGRINQIQDIEVLKMLQRQAVLADTLAEFEEALTL